MDVNIHTIEESGFEDQDLPTSSRTTRSHRSTVSELGKNKFTFYYHSPRIRIERVKNYEARFPAIIRHRNAAERSSQPQ